MRKMKLIGMGAIPGQQQPTSEARLNYVVTRTGRRLRELAHQHVDIAIQSLSQRRALFPVTAENVALILKRGARTLHQGVLRGNIHAENQGSSQHAFVTHDPDFQPCAVVESSHQRNETIRREVNVANPLA